MIQMTQMEQQQLPRNDVQRSLPRDKGDRHLYAAANAAPPAAAAAAAAFWERLLHAL